MDRTACLDDPLFLAVAIGKTRDVINQVVSMFDGEQRGEGVPCAEWSDGTQSEEESSAAVIHSRLLIL